MSEDNQKTLSRYGKPIYTRNPTIPAAGAISKTRRTQIGNDKRGVVIDQSNGEILGHGGAMIYEFEEVDKERFVKLYLAGLKNAVGMSKAGLSVFQLVYDQMREHKERDYVLLAGQETTMPLRTYQRGLRELIERGFLYQSAVAGKYWVNIQFMFNGNRLAFVKAYQVKGTAQQLDLLSPIEDEAESGDSI